MMGDEIRIGAEDARRRHTGVFEHYCEHPGCKEWGSWGYSRTKLETRWFCREHRDDGETWLGRQ